MSESRDLDGFEDLLRSQSLGIAPPDVASLMYQCGQAAAQEVAKRQEGRRRWSQVAVAATIALVSGIVLDRTTLSRPSAGEVTPHIAATPNVMPELPAVPQPDPLPLDPRILRASSRLTAGMELAQLDAELVDSPRPDESSEGPTLSPALRVLDVRALDLPQLPRGE